MREKLREVLEDLRSILTDDGRRARFQYEWIYILLAVISAFMTIVNVATNKGILMCSTLIFAALCAFDYAFSRLGERELQISSYFLSAELIGLFSFFLISGEPEGFAAIWACLLPACGMVLYGRRRGVRMSLVMLAILIFFLWVPFGNALCRFEYTASFRLRFPFLYCASFLLALFLEIVRELTQSELARIQKDYEHLCYNDALTGLNNRAGFEKAIVHFVQMPMSCLMIDLDYFKKVNDTYGHAAGDIVLREAGRILRQTLGDDWVLVRWGGEEFVAMAEERFDPSEAADRLCRAFRAHVFHLPDGTDLHVTISVGAIRSDGSETTDEIMIRVDECLYRAKEAGRDRFIVG